MTKTGVEFENAPAIIRLSEYGAFPDSGADAQPVMRRAIEAAAALGRPAVIECGEEEAIRLRAYSGVELSGNRFMEAVRFGE